MTTIGIVAIACLGATSVLALEPPKIVSTSPKFWEVGVAPSLKAVSVSFDQTMRSGFWDFLGNNTLSPPTNYETTMGADRKSFSLNVKLQPGKVYILGFNERKIPGVGFQNEKGISLPPTYLVFQTAGTPTADDAPPNVTKTVPSNGATAVDPTKLRSITISFDTPMNIKKHGLHLFEDSQSVDISRSAFQYSTDGKVFTLAYAFKPSKTYKLELNNLQDLGFSRLTWVPLWPLHFTFTTGQPR